MEEILSRLPEPMQPNISTFVIAIIFLVLLVVLNNLIFKPLVRIMDERAKKISDGEKAAEQARRTVEESHKNYQSKKTDALKNAQKQRQEVLAEVERHRSEAMAEALGEARAKVAEQSGALKTRVEEARSSLQADADQIAKQIADTILSRTA